MEKPTARASLYKHFDWERKNAKQAEARLGQRLQRLEAICLHRVALLTREQKQVQEDLNRLQQGDISHIHTTTPTLPPSHPLDHVSGDHTEGAVVSYLKALATVRTQEAHEANAQVPPFHHTGLRNPTTNKGKSLPQNDRTSPFTGQKPQVQEADSINPPTGKDPSQGDSVLCQDQVSANTPDQGPSCSPSGKSRAGHAAESRSNDANLKPDLNLTKCTGNFNGESP
ncbi:hypothetical protein MC885_020532, partial [Smutsia gigantea]